MLYTLSMTPIQRATAIIGGAAKMADLTGVTKGAVYQWLAGERPVPATRAPVIEHACGGAVTADELCPGVPWSLVRKRKSKGRRAA